MNNTLSLSWKTMKITTPTLIILADLYTPTQSIHVCTTHTHRHPLLIKILTPLSISLSSLSILVYQYQY